MDETLEDRLAALERALTDENHDLGALAADGEVANRIQTAESDIEDLTERVAELEAATQALRGYVGNVRAVNEEVRERADLALETAERVEAASTETEPHEPKQTDLEPTDSSPSKSERVASRGGDDRPTADQQPSDRAPGNDEREPTLELAADRRTQAADNHSQSPDNRCPVCDGDTSRSGRSRPQKRDAEQSESPPSDRLHGLTDGGRVHAAEGSPPANNPGLLTRIRSLL